MDKTKKGKWTDKNLEKAYYNGCKDTREEFERLIDGLKKGLHRKDCSGCFRTLLKLEQLKNQLRAGK